MTVIVQTPVNSYVANGVTTVFPYTFKIIDDEDMLVLVDNVEVGSGYTVSGVGVEAGGNVTFSVAPTNGQSIVVMRSMALTRDFDYQEGGDLLADTLDADIDRTVLLIQQLQEEIDRSYKSSPGSGAAPEFPPIEASKFIRGSADGQTLEFVETEPETAIRGDLALSTGADLVGYGSTTVGDKLDTLREVLSTTRNYYVRTDGNDSNTGLSDTSGGAFLTLQKAADVVWKSLDTKGHQITINVADGTYTAGVSVSGPVLGGGSVYFIGNTTTPANCIINATNDAFKADLGASFGVRGFKVQSSAGAGITAYRGSSASFQLNNFGVCAGSHVEVGQNSTIIADGNYTISGGATSHWHVGSPGLFYASAITVTLTGTPAFSAYFAGVAEGTITFGGVTFSGSATGTRYLAHKNGVIDSGASGTLTSLPGSVDGLERDGGRYVIDSQWSPRYKLMWSGSTTSGVAMSSLLCGAVSGQYLVRTPEGDFDLGVLDTTNSSFGSMASTGIANTLNFALRSLGTIYAGTLTVSTGVQTVTRTITAIYRLC